MNQTDSFIEEVKQGYTTDMLFAKILAHLEQQQAFTIHDRLIWVKKTTLES
jgi:hypothetical protein